MVFSFFKSIDNKAINILESLSENQIGLQKDLIWNKESFDRFSSLSSEKKSEIILSLIQYKQYFYRLQKNNLNVTTHYHEILKLASPIFNMSIDFKLLPNITSDDIVVHAYSISGHCLFFTPNFLKYVKYDLLTLLIEPWFELFGRLHEDDIDIYMKSNNEFLNMNLKKAVDITYVRPNVIYLEKISGRPSIKSKGYFYFPVFDENNGFKATLVASSHNLDG